MTALASLIARLEAAEGPITDYMERRDIAEMARAAGLTAFQVGDLLKALRGSLDSALSLVPEGYHVRLIQASAPGRRDWSASCEKRDEYGWHPRHTATALGPAAALTAAALKARAQG